MPFLRVDAIIGNQAFHNRQCHICFSLGLDIVETGHNLLMDLKAVHKKKAVHIQTDLFAIDFYLLVGSVLSLQDH